MAADNMDVPSWKNISPTTPQQCDGQSCGVYVIKVSSNTNCFSVSKRESNSEHSFVGFFLQVAEFVVEEKKPFISQVKYH